MSNETTTTALLGESFPINQLVRRFAEEWAEQRTRTENPVTRVASFNLVVVSRDKHLDSLQEVLQGLGDSHPARVIWIKLEEGREWESSTARLHLGSRCDCDQVCSEQIQICCGHQPERVSSIVLPLIRAGLSTHLLWWHAGPPNGVLFDRLTDRARLILLVNENWPELAALLPSLWADTTLQEHTFIPLAWHEILQARQSVAAAYGQSDITLEFSHDSDSDPHMNLLQLWVQALIDGRDSLSGWKGEGVKMLETHSETGTAYLKWGEFHQTLQAQSSLDAVRAALNRPHRDPVFAKIIKILEKRHSMRTIDVLKSETYSQEVIQRITSILNQRDKEAPFHLFLSGGSTPVPVYAGLAEQSIDWKGVHFWWGDERFVPPDHPDSNYRMACEQLIDKIDIPALQVHPWPILSSPELSAETYNREFREYFVDEGQTLNFQLLGMGDDGHTASLFPGTSALSEEESFCVSNYVEGKQSVRLTLTYPAIALSERVVFVVEGKGKADAVKSVLEDSIHPSARVEGKNSVEFWLDERAASLLSEESLKA